MKVKFSPPVTGQAGPALTALQNKRYPFLPPIYVFVFMKSPATAQSMCMKRTKEPAKDVFQLVGKALCDCRLWCTSYRFRQNVSSKNAGSKKKIPVRNPRKLWEGSPQPCRLCTAERHPSINVRDDATGVSGTSPGYPLARCLTLFQRTTLWLGNNA